MSGYPDKYDIEEESDDLRVFKKPKMEPYDSAKTRRALYEKVSDTAKHGGENKAKDADQDSYESSETVSDSNIQQVRVFLETAQRLITAEQGEAQRILEAQSKPFRTASTHAEDSDVKESIEVKKNVKATAEADGTSQYSSSGAEDACVEEGSESEQSMEEASKKARGSLTSRTRGGQSWEEWDEGYYADKE